MKRKAKSHAVVLGLLINSGVGICHFLAERIAPKLRAALEDENRITNVAGFSYRFLPPPVRFIVSKKRFVEVVQKARRVVVEAVAEPAV